MEPIVQASGQDQELVELRDFVSNWIEKLLFVNTIAPCAHSTLFVPPKKY
jgi:hypothetical protein